MSRDTIARTRPQPAAVREGSGPTRAGTRPRRARGATADAAA